MSDARIFRYFKTRPEIIRLAVMMYVRYPLSLRNVEDLLHERGIDITRETVRFTARFTTNSLRGPSVQPGATPLIQINIQETTHRRSQRVASTLCCLINAGAGDIPRFFWFA